MLYSLAVCGRRFFAAIAFLTCFGGLADVAQAMPVSACHGEEVSLSAMLPDAQAESRAAFMAKIVEPKEFYGLASYFNSVRFFRVNAGQAEALPPGEEVVLAEGEWFAAIGRFNALVVQANGAGFTPAETDFTVKGAGADAVQGCILTKDALPQQDTALNQLRYSHLWAPFAALSKGMEWLLVTIQGSTGAGWGWTVVIFAILLKLLMVPVGLLTVHFQRQVSQYQAILAPQLAEIKKNYKGEAAHTRMMAAHKAIGISPFYTLKPMIGMFVQVPVLIAVFNALGEMPQFVGQSFLWIADLAYPDAVMRLPFALPLLGDQLNLLPFLMTIVTIVSTIIFRNRHAPAAEVKKQKRNLYLMALAFFVLFYPFSAVMVLFWLLANVLQTIQQQIIRL